MSAWVVGLTMSGVLHATLVLSLLAVVGGTESRMVFVDLFQDQGVGKPRAAETPAPGGAPPRKPAPARSAPPIPAVALAAAAQPPRVEAPTPAASPMGSEPVRPAPEPLRPASEPVRPTLDPPLVPLSRIVETSPPTGLVPTGGESGASAAVAPRLSERSAAGGREGAARSSPGARRPGAGVSLSDMGGGAAGGGAGSEARDGSPLALAVARGGGDSASGDYAGYYDTLRRRIHESLSYPPAARRRGAAGTVVVDVEIEPTGAVGRVTLVASSSHAMLDEAALEAVRGLPPVPFPSGVPPRRLRVRLPVVFELR